MIKKQLKNIKGYLYWALKGQYNPDKFWQEWGKTFIDDPVQHTIYPQHKWILKIINYEKPKTLVEVGCGFGRNIKYILENYPHPLAITGMDVSSTMLANAKKYLKDYLKSKNAKIKLKRASILDLPFPSSSLDLVLCHGVLMHVEPANIKQAISEIIRISRKTIIVVEENDSIKSLNGKPYQKINYYTYTYPYRQLFEKEGAGILKYLRRNQLDWFLLSKRISLAKHPNNQNNPYC